MTQPQPQKAPLPKIAHFDTKGKFLKVRAAMSPDRQKSKIFLEIIQYDPKGPGDKNIYVHHAVNTMKAMALCDALIQHAYGTEGFDFKEFKGTDNSNYPTGAESRVLAISKVPKMRGTGFAFIVSISNGPGVKQAGGAVSPADGAQATKISFVLDELGILEFANSIKIWIQSYYSGNITEIAEAFVADEMAKRYD